MALLSMVKIRKKCQGLVGTVRKIFQVWRSSQWASENFQKTISKNLFQRHRFRRIKENLGSFGSIPQGYFIIENSWNRGTYSQEIYRWFVISLSNFTARLSFTRWTDGLSHPSVIYPHNISIQRSLRFDPSLIRHRNKSRTSKGTTK